MLGDKHFQLALIVVGFETTQHLLGILSKEDYIFDCSQKDLKVSTCISLQQNQDFFQNTSVGNISLYTLSLYSPAGYIQLLFQISTLIRFLPHKPRESSTHQQFALLLNPSFADRSCLKQRLDPFLVLGVTARIPPSPLPLKKTHLPSILVYPPGMQESCFYIHGQYDSEQRYKYRISCKCPIKSFEFLSLFCWIINTG